MNDTFEGANESVGMEGRTETIGDGTSETTLLWSETNAPHDILNKPEPINELVVGSGGCSFHEIVTTISPASSNILVTKWKDIARSMEVDAETIHRENLWWTEGRNQITDVYVALLENWKMRKVKQATVQSLIDILRDNGCHDSACTTKQYYFLSMLYRLLEKYYHSCWESLKKAEATNTRHYRLLIGMTVSTFVALLLGIAIGLCVHYFLPPNKVLYRNSVPLLPKSYIPRRLSSRVEMSHDIILEKSNLRPIFTGSNDPEISDTLVFSGIDTYKIQELVPYGQAVSIDDALAESSVKCRYITELHSLSQFDMLCSMRIHISLHWLHYQNSTDSFIWKKSCGEMGYIQNVVNSGSKLLHEDFFLTLPFFIQDISAVKRSGLFRQPVIIHGSSGTGKRTLLAKVGNTFNNSTNMKILFADFFSFIEEVAKLQTRDATFKDTILKVIADIACENDVCKNDFGYKISSFKLLILFDAFDRTPSEYLQSGQAVLNEIATWSSTLIIITTKPNYLNFLENTLKTMAYQIKPLSSKVQKEFLVDFWLKGNPNLDKEQLRNFAKNRIDIVNRGLSTSDKNVTGIALLTVLMAEVYQDLANRWCDSKYESCLQENLDNEVVSLRYLFETFVDIRLKQHYSSVFIRKEILEIHCLEAIRLKFPTLVLPKSTYSLDEILQAGLLDKCTDYPNRLRFIYPALVGYFVAQYVSNCNSAETFCADVYRAGLTVERGAMKYKKGFTEFQITTYTFTHNHIAYFFEKLAIMDSFVHECQHLPDKRLQFYFALVQNDMFHLFLRFQSCIKFSVQTLEQLVKLAVISSSLRFVELLAQKYAERHHAVDIQNFLVDCYETIESFCNLLELSALRGNSEIFILLYTNYFKSEALGEYVVHNTVTESFLGYDQQLEDNKLDIIKFLATNVDKGSDIFEASGELCPPMFYAHTSKLLLKLMYNGANATIVCPTKGTILHHAIKSFSLQGLYLIMTSLDTLGFLTSEMINFQTKKVETALDTYIAEMEQHEKILKLFKKASKNDFHAFNPFCKAIFHGRNSQSLKLLMNHFPSWYNCIGVSNNFMYAVHCNHVSAANLTLSENPKMINWRDEKGYTPLYYSFEKYYSKSINESITPLINFLLQSNANTNMPCGPRNASSFLVAVQTANLAVTKKLVANGACVQCKDAEDNTALHYALNPFNRFDDEYSVIKYLIRQGKISVRAINKQNRTAVEEAVLAEWKYGLSLKTIKFLAVEEAIAPAVAKVLLRKILKLCNERYDDDAAFTSAIDELKNYGANLYEVMEFGQNYLHLSVKNLCVSGVVYFLKIGVDVNKEDDFHRTPLFYANSTTEKGVLIREILVEHHGHP